MISLSNYNFQYSIKLELVKYVGPVLTYYVAFRLATHCTV